MNSSTSFQLGSFKVGFVILGFWTVLSALTSAQVYFGLSSQGETTFSYWSLLPLHISAWYLWAALTPLIFRLGNRFPVSAENWRAAFAVHLPVSILVAVMYILLANIINALFENEVLFSQRFYENFRYFLFREFHRELLMYWLILSSGLAFTYYRKYQARKGHAHDIIRPNAKSETESDSVPIERLVVKSAGNVIFVKVEDIDWIQAADYYIEVHSKGTQHLLRQSMSDLERKLDPQKFPRIHRSTIVNIERIKEMQHYYRGDYIVLLHDGTKLKLSRSRRKKLQAILGQAF